MFGIGGSEILVILVVALLFLGPDKLPDAAKTISKGIRDLKRQSRALQQQIESDEQIGGAIRDLKSALRGDDFPPRPPVRKEPPALPSESNDEPSAASENPAPDGQPAAALTLPPTAGEPDPDVPDAPDLKGDELGHLIKPAAGTVAKNEPSTPPRAPATTPAPASTAAPAPTNPPAPIAPSAAPAASAAPPPTAATPAPASTPAPAPTAPSPPTATAARPAGRSSIPRMPPPPFSRPPSARPQPAAAAKTEGGAKPPVAGDGDGSK